MDNNSTKAMAAGVGARGLGYGAVGAGGSGAMDGEAAMGEASFQNTLQAAQSTKPVTEAGARKVAGDLVSFALIMPMLKQIRRDPLGQNTIFSAGTGEKTFGPEFDMQLAERIAHSPRMTVTDALGKQVYRWQQRRLGIPVNQGSKQNGIVKQTSGVDIHG